MTEMKATDETWEQALKYALSRRAPSALPATICVLQLKQDFADLCDDFNDFHDSTNNIFDSLFHRIEALEAAVYAEEIIIEDSNNV